MNWTRCRHHAAWLALPVGVGAYLLWREVQAQAHWPLQASAVVAPTTVEVQRALPVAALALAFGFQAADAKASTRSDIVLKASFVSSDGEARALLTSNGKDATYRVGDRLPGGGVVRRIEPRAITLWVDGHEETLGLAGATGTLLRPASMAASPQPLSTPPLHLLRNPL